MNRDNYTVFSSQSVFGMANLNPKKTGLSVVIWSEHAGIERKKKYNDARVKLGLPGNGPSVSISIESEPKILARSKNIKNSDMKKIQKGIEYVGRNYDLFLNQIPELFTI